MKMALNNEKRFNLVHAKKKKTCKNYIKLLIFTYQISKYHV